MCQFARLFSKAGITLKMIVIIVTFIFRHHCIPFGADGLDVEAVHRFVIRGVEPR